MMGQRRGAEWVHEMAADSGSYRTWRTDENKLFVHCSNPVHGDASLHPAGVKYMCSKGHEAVEHEFFLTTTGDLESVMKANAEIPMFCYICNQNMPGRAFLKCRGGAKSGGQRCHETTVSASCGWLAQTVVPPPGQVCEVLFTEPENGALFRFDPCGHYVSQEALSGAVRSLVEGGSGSAKLAVSPETGQFSFTCPLGCENSFLHDIHHFKTCGDNQWYEHMKTWAVERLLAKENPQIPAPIPKRSRVKDSTASLRAVQDALTDAAFVQCPRCSAAGQINASCTHITCTCSHRYCYICTSALVKGMCPRKCAMFLYAIPELGENPPVAVQRFHVLKTTQNMHAIYLMDPMGLKQVLKENPRLLSGICSYDGYDENGRYHSHLHLPGVSLSYEKIESFRPPPWLLETE